MKFPLFQPLLEVIEAVMWVDFVKNCESAIFVTNPLLCLCLNKDLEDVDEETSVDNGGVIRKDLFVNGR